MKYFLFDLDGTLTNPHEGITKCVQYALDYFGIHEEDLDKLDVFIGPPLTESFQKYYGLSYEDSLIALKKYRERFETVGLYENEKYEGIEKVLQCLKERNKKIYLATSKPEKFAIKILEYFNLDKYFDGMVGASMDLSRNKKCDVIKEVFDRYSIKDTDNAIMIGDRAHDILGAKQMNIKSIGVYYGFAKKGELEKAGADYIVDTIDELVGIIKQI